MSDDSLISAHQSRFGHMGSAVAAYLDKEASAHRVDARSKILMLAIYSVSIFFVDAWLGMAIYLAMLLAAFCAVHASSQLSARRILTIATPVYVIAALTLFFNMFQGEGGGFAFSIEGLSRGCFFAARILLLVWASLILCFNVNSIELVRAFDSLLSPLAAFRVPVSDVSTVLSIALRFIPQMAEEFFAIRDVQWSRGVPFDEGSLASRIKAHFSIFIPMFVGMFRRADKLALAMDVRCYGLPGVNPSELREASFGAMSILALIATLLVCLGVAILL